MNLLIKDGFVVGDKVYEKGAVVIEGNKILDIGYSEDILRRYDAHGYVEIDASDKLIIPGLINSHSHIAMTMLRGYADDMFLQEWLEKWIWPVESVMTDKDVELGALVGAAESLLGGVTSVCSLYYYYPDHNEASAALKAKLRLIFGVAMFSWDEDKSIKNVEDALKKWHGAGNGLIRVSLSPHATYTVSPKLWKEVERLRKFGEEKYGEKGRVIVTSHVLEDWNEVKMVKEKFNVDIPQGSMYRYLDDLGVLSPHFLAAHSIHMNDVDFEVVRRRGVKIAHNPVANLKLAMGIANIPKMLEYGINVSLGTDGPASNNTLDLIETMKVTALIHKEMAKNPTVLPANSVFKMATEYGANSIGYENLGVIRKDAIADIVLINLKKPNLTPFFDPFSHLVYALKSADVDTVIVDGELVVEDAVLKTIDLEELLEKASKRSFEIVDEAKEMKEGGYNA